MKLNSSPILLIALILYEMFCIILKKFCNENFMNKREGKKLFLSLKFLLSHHLSKFFV